MARPASDVIRAGLRLLEVHELKLEALRTPATMNESN